jgi:hypothetical protein
MKNLEKIKDVYRKSDILTVRPSLDGKTVVINYKCKDYFLRTRTPYEPAFDKYRPIDWIALIAYISDVQFSPIIQTLIAKTHQNEQKTN